MSVEHSLEAISQALRDALFPARCIECLQEGTWYCAVCRRHTPPHILQCIGCKTEYPSGRTCKDCREEVSLYGFISARNYSDHAIQRAVEWLKFKGVRDLADILAALLIPKLPTIAPIDDLSKHATLVPLPLHTSRLNQRGFNQSEDIARAIGTVCSIEVAPLLTRTQATASQAKLPHELRAKNMDNAFALCVPEQEYLDRVREKPIVIIVDDVSTTGTTLISASKALPKHPDAQVWGAAIARG